MVPDASVQPFNTTDGQPCPCHRSVFFLPSGHLRGLGTPPSNSNILPQLFCSVACFRFQLNYCSGILYSHPQTELSAPAMAFVISVFRTLYLACNSFCDGSFSYSKEYHPWLSFRHLVSRSFLSFSRYVDEQSMPREIPS